MVLVAVFIINIVVTTTFTMIVTKLLVEDHLPLDDED